MKNIFLVLSVLILPLISVRAGDEDDVLRAERELALCYQAGEVLDELLAEVSRFTGGAPFADDVCLVAAEVPVWPNG